VIYVPAVNLQTDSEGNNVHLCAVKASGSKVPTRLSFSLTDCCCAEIVLVFWSVQRLFKFVNFNVNSAVDQGLSGDIRRADF
jgi:hypothetical protein